MMSHVSGMLRIAVLALLVLIACRGESSCFAAEPEQVKQSKSKAPTRNKHYVKQTFHAKGGASIDYWLMSPAKIEDGRKYPVVLALHGRGGNTEAATRLGSDALRKEYPCFVIAPSSTSDGHWARPAGFGKRRKKGKNTKAMLPIALQAVDALIEEHAIDTNRVYVTGQSMGGAGTFGAMALRPQLFAAAMPVCGAWNPKDADKMKDVAIWVFHGDKDKVVPTEYSRKMIAGIKASGGSPRYTEYKGVAHNSWSQTYASPETWSWLFKQRRAH